MNTLQENINQLFRVSISPQDIKKNVSLKTLKLNLLEHVFEELGLTWTTVENLLKKYTPIHPEIAAILKTDRRVVENEKLEGILKEVPDLDFILAVDGLNGEIKPNYKRENYMHNLRYGEGETIFDDEPEYMKLHVQAIRKMYKLIGNATPVPAKWVYHIVYRCIEEMTRVLLPREPDVVDSDIDAKILQKCVSLYNLTMGKENVESLVKYLNLA